MFEFYTRLHLIELTGTKAATLPDLLEGLRTVSGASIYHHTFHFVQKHQYLTPEPSNDFAYWISEILGDKRLGEELAGVDIMAHHTIRSIREVFIEKIELALKSRPRLRTLVAPEGGEFIFLKSVSFVFPSRYRAQNLGEFAECLKQISISSIYFHMFESHIRLERPTNDFSDWLANTLNENQLALKIARLSPYTMTGEGLREKLLELINKRIS